MARYEDNVMLWLYPPMTGSFATGIIIQSSLFATLAEPEVSAIVWQDCSSHYQVGFSCANLTVPLSWDCTNEQQIVLGMSRCRFNSTDTHQTGNLLVNYGGPGGSGTQSLKSSVRTFTDEIRDKFDISKGSSTAPLVHATR